MTPKILFVDDDPNLLAGLQRSLRKLFTFDTALGGQAGLDMIRSNGPYAVLVVDMQMPGMDGVVYLEQASQLLPDAVRIMLTGNADQKTAVDAVNRGQVFRFLSKPCPSETLAAALETALKHFELLQMERELLEGTLTGCVKILSEVLGMAAPDALGRGLRLRESIGLFARSIGAGPVWELEIAALLSSIGYASLPVPLQRRLASSALISAEEERLLRRLPQVGHDLLVGIPRLSGVARIVLYQNKAFDGTGFPFDSVGGDQLPLGARMLKILVDRLRHEMDGLDRQAAHEAMRERTGAYDPVLLGRCFESVRSILSGAAVGDGLTRACAVRELVAGMTVVAEVTTSEGLLLLGKGSRLTEVVIQRLRNYDELGSLKHPLMMRGAMAGPRDRAA